MKNTKTIFTFLVVALFAASSLFVIAEIPTKQLSESDDEYENTELVHNGCILHGDPIELETAKLFFEVNDADQDTGIHGEFDTGSFAKLCVYSPDGKKLLEINPKKELKELGMSGFFFESREPPHSEISIEEHMENFPEGEYNVRGITHDGISLTGTAIFSHTIPMAPEIIYPEENDVVSIDNLVVDWEPVTQTIYGEDVEIVGYQVIVTEEIDPHPNARYLPRFDVYVPASQTSLSISSEFLQPGALYELEVIAIEETGNQIISIVFFETES